MTSLRAKIFIKIMKAMSMKDEGIFDVKKKRENLEKRVSMFKMPRKVKVEHIDVDGIPAEWLYPHNSEKNRVILYLHGGYYTSGSPKTHRSLAARIGKTSNSPVLLIDYRLAPENPFPAALEDSISAYNWITKQKGIKTNKLMIAGDSAGGGLVLATLIKLRDEKNALPAAAICLSPWTDLALTGDSIKTKADEELMLTEIEVRQAAQFYLKEGLHRYHSWLGTDPTDHLIHQGQNLLSEGCFPSDIHRNQKRHRYRYHNLTARSKHAEL